MDLDQIKKRALAELDAPGDPSRRIACALSSLVSDFGAEDRWHAQLMTCQTIGLMKIAAGLMDQPGMRDFIEGFNG
jgi:hypothetical protein